MRKSKRLLAFTLAALQILMLLPSTGMSAYAEEPEAVSESVESDEQSGVLPSDPVEGTEDSLEPVEDAGAILEPSGVLPSDPVEGTEDSLEPVEDAGAIENEGQAEVLPAEPTESTGDPAKQVESTEPSEVLPADPVEDAEVIENKGQAGVLPSDEPNVFYTLKVVDTYADTQVSDVRYEESLPAGQGYSFSALEADGYVVEGDAEYQGELTEDTTLEFVYDREYTVTFYDIIMEEVITKVKVKSGEAAEAPEAPVYEGFKFIGWSEEFSSVSSDLTVETLYQALGVSPMSAGTELSNDYASAILYEDEKRLVVTGMFKSGTHRSNYPWYEKLSGYSVEFTDDVTFIGDYAFQSSGIIGELVIPNSVTSIGGGAFDSCSGLTGDLIIPDSVTSIGSSAFQACKGLTGDLVIPDSVTSIGDYAFEYCSGFSDTLILGNSLKTIGGGAFNFCNNITIIQGGENVTTVPDGYCFVTDEATPTTINTSNEILLNHDWAAENRVVKAKVLYTISFDSEGGTPVESISVIEDEYAEKPEDPTKPGYKFLGWMREGYGIFSFDTTVIREDVTLRAIWKEKPDYQIYFFSNGGTFVPELLVREDEYAEKPEDPTQENYKFLGWKTSDDAEDYFNFETTPVTRNILLYAQWEVKDTITVTFDSNGGTPVASLELNKVYDDADTEHLNGYAYIPEPEAPTKEGCEFRFWRHYGSKFDFESPVTSDITLYAEWVDLTITVTFDTQGGTPIESLKLKKVYNEWDTEHSYGYAYIPEPEAPTKEGCEFKYWSYYGYEFDFERSVTSDTTLYAIWIDPSKKATVTFDSQGGTPVDSQEVLVNTNAVAPEAPTREGYEFKYWSKYNWDYKPEFYFASEIITSDITLYAVWFDPNETFTVTFDSDGGTPVDSQEVLVNTNAVEPEVPTKEGYIFGFWRLDLFSDYPFAFENEIITRDITLYARWYAPSEICTVTFETYGGTLIDSQKVIQGRCVTEPKPPEREGYNFAGWFTDESFTYYYNFWDAVYSDITLYAKWEEKVIYTVTFDSNGGTPVASQEVPSGEYVTVPESPEREGYKFVGWSASSFYFDPYYFETPIYFNRTLYAEWEKTTFTVTFDTNGGTSVDPQEVEPNGKATEPADPVKDGFVFEYWYRDADGASVPFNFESTIITEDMTLCALWTEVSRFTITVIDEYYDVDGTTLLSSETRSSEAFPEGSSYNYEALNTVGYKVLGQSSYTGTVTEDLTVTFKYAEDVSVLGGTLVLSIPAEMELAYDASTGAYMKTDSVYASGRCGMKKRLDVQTPQHITFVNNDDDSVVIENAKVTFGSAVSDGSMQEQWSAAELREGIGSPVGKSISVAVDKAAIDYLGSYSSLITYNVSLVENLKN